MVGHELSHTDCMWRTLNRVSWVPAVPISAADEVSEVCSDILQRERESLVRLHYTYAHLSIETL